ncbi:MAG: hypothetical protein JO217_09905 [Acidobacteriaceae bacterium]|nr:hypothetical protein [Acidobacteriaceae bacterium]
MPFKDLVGKAQELTGTAAEATGKFLDEFNEALPTMRALGFSLSDFRVGMGIIPEIGAKLIASTDTVDVKKIDELIKKQEEKKTLVAILKALQAAFNIKQQLNIPFKGVQVDVKLACRRISMWGSFQVRRQRRWPQRQRSSDRLGGVR